MTVEEKLFNSPALLSQVLATADSAARSATKVVAIENLIMNTGRGYNSGGS